MFTLIDIRDIAIQLERNGEESYRLASEAVSDSKIAIIFRWLAEEERRHACFFANLVATQNLSPEQAKVEEMGRDLLQDMVRDKTFSLDQESLNNAANLRDMLCQCRDFEQDTVLFYEFLLAIVDEAEVKRQLESIIEEERRHVAVLTRMAANELVEDLLPRAAGGTAA